MGMKKKIGILFDLDGTLLDTLQDLTDSVNYALDQCGYPQVTDRNVRAYLGNGARELIRLSIGAEQSDPAVDKVLGVFKPHYEANCQIKTRPYAGIPEAMEQLGQKYPIGIVSNKPDIAVKPLCAALFPGVYCLGEREGCPRKPAPDMLHRAMAALDMEACVYVGDSEVDVVTAKNAGLPCVSVLWGFRDRPEIESAGGSCFCEVPQMLVEAVENLIRKEF
jgi:phosphoglycolate phosphatase